MNANEQIKIFTSTESYYRHLGSYLYTDGVRELGTEFKCYWFLDIVVSYQSRLRNHEFQVWKLTKSKNSSAVVVCTDCNKKELVRQYIQFTDFKATEATLWFENNVILLPSER